VPVPGVAEKSIPLPSLTTKLPVDSVTSPTNVGAVAKTLSPVPVFVTLTTFLLASKAKAVEAVNADNVVVPETERLTPLRSEPPSTRCHTVPL
jgi:hypothetical protein